MWLSVVLCDFLNQLKKLRGSNIVGMIKSHPQKDGSLGRDPAEDGFDVINPMP